MEKEIIRIVWSDLAVSTLQIIDDYISEYSIKQADKQIERILDRIELLRKGWTKIGQKQDFDSRKMRFEYRYLVQDNYKIIYHIEENTIVIDIVFDGRQNHKSLRKLLSRRRK